MFENEQSGSNLDESTSNLPDSGSGGAIEGAPADAIDLSTLDKFKFQDKDWTPKELEQAIIRQSDYTRKTQSLAEERKFYDNLAYDIARVIKQPELLEQFKQIYPEKFHKYINEAFGDYLKQPAKAQEQNGKQSAFQDSEAIRRLEAVEKRFFDQEVQSAEAQIEAIFSEKTTKYPFADESSVLAKAQALLDKKESLTPDVWEKLFKSDHDRISKKASEFYSKQVKTQTQANRKAKDTAPGGGIPSEAPKRKTMKEATEDAIRDLTAR